MKRFITLTLVVFMSFTILQTRVTAIEEENNQEQITEDIVKETEEIEKQEEISVEKEIVEENIPEEDKQEESIEENVPEAEEQDAVVEEENIPETEKQETTVEEENIPEEIEKQEEQTQESEPTEDFDDVETERAIVSLTNQNKQLEEVNLLQTYTPTDIELEEYFKLDQETLTYNGSKQVPEIVPSGDIPSFNYHIDFEIVSAVGGRLIAEPINVGNYILRAVISYSEAETLLGQLIFQKTKVLEFPFSIVPKDVTGFVKSELEYNENPQYPTLYSNYKALVEGVDFRYSETDNYPQDNHTDAEDSEGPITHKVDIELINYTVNRKSSYTVEYEIGKRFLDIQDEIVYTYTGDVITPEIYGMHADKKINLKSDDYSVAMDSEYKNPKDDYVATLTLNDSFFYNNKINEADSNIEDEIYTITIPAKINEATIEYSFDELYYDGTVKIPDITFTGVDGKNLNEVNEHIKINRVPVDDEGYEIAEPKEIGKYWLNVEMVGDTSEYYIWPEDIRDSTNKLAAKICYEIKKSDVEFAGWDFDTEDKDKDGVVEIEGKLLSITATFKYTMDGDKLCLEYNGFNPFLFRTEYGYAPIPGAKYKYAESGVEISSDLISRKDYEYYPQIPSEALKLGVGTYHATICLDNDYYGTNSAKATFEVTPKPVTLNWTKTTIDISEKDLNPQCEIEGLVPIDKLGFKLVKKDDGIDWETTDRAVVEFGDYYKYNSPEDTDANVVAYYPRKYRPTEEGKYKVDVRNIVYRFSGIVDKNYVLTGETSVNYIIVDKSTVEEKGQITVGTIDKVDKTVINGIKLNAPTEEEMLTVISKLSETDSDGAQKLLNALNADKNVNVYLVANTLEDTSGIILPTNNCIVVDLQLFAYVEGSNEQYPLTDTGTYNFGIDVTLTKKQADDLGYGPGKCFYIARYHGTNTPEYTQMAEPIVSGTGDDTTYTFKIRSNKFSDYAIYVGNKPVHIETEDHVIPYTGA